ncbi:histidine kinase [Sedimentibacter sp.]|uniref:sensor histidine kinase n=1 Tax=Sedimentibacter sp. TaxID=1960295 RepID=UPI0028AF832B|nr:histidine kinase [Sedimentibacter sp.]
MLAKKPSNVNPQELYLIIMIMQFFILLNIIIPVSGPMVFLLFIFTVFSMILRWRFDLNPKYMLIDEGIIILISILYPSAHLFLFIFAYYFAYKNKFIYMIPIIITGFVFNYQTLYLLLMQAIIFGTILYLWSRDNAYNINLTDNLRRRIYELEQVQSHLLSDYQDTERISRLTERQRIAEILHDSLGHELTAAHLSIKAYKALIDNNKQEQAQNTLKKVEKKIEHSLKQLKDSVKYIEPYQEHGFSDLTYLIEKYTYHIDFTHSGDILKLKPYIWQLILISVKEALTNITKHATPEHITLKLAVTDYIVKLVIENDGIKDNSDKISGNGLRYMRSRLEAINGSLSIQKQDGFKLIIIIPIENGR